MIIDEIDNFSPSYISEKINVISSKSPFSIPLIVDKTVCWFSTRIFFIFHSSWLKCFIIVPFLSLIRGCFPLFFSTLQSECCFFCVRLYKYECMNIFDKNKSWMHSHSAKAEHCWNVAPRRPADFQRSDKNKSSMWENNLTIWQCSLSLDNTYHINVCYLIKINSMN